MKNTSKVFGALCAVILAACFITGCPDPTADPDNPQVEPVQPPRSVRYISTDSDNNRYTLVITESKSRNIRAVYTPKSGDTFVLTVEMYNNGNYTVSITSSGNVRNSSGAKIDLQLSANDSSLTLTVTIGNDEMTGINGTIVSDDGKTEMQIEEPVLRPAIVKTNLKAALDAAATAKAGVIVSANGSDVLATAFWVITEQMSVFNSAISTAQAVYDNGEAKQAAVDTAEASLLTAIVAFNGQKKAGSKSGAAPTLTGIAISAPPTKTEYEIGDTLDLAGLIVTAAYSDDTTAVIGVSELTAGGFDASTPGNKSVTITYNGKSASFTVTVNPAAPVFTSIAAFGYWLSAQAENTAAATYRAKLNVNDLGGVIWTDGSVANVLDTNRTKYVNLDLSGSTITSIGQNAFAYCTSLTGVTIPNSVTSIEYYAFSDCTSLVAINLDSGNANYIFEQGVLYNKNKTLLHTYPAGKAETTFAIPNSVTSIGDGAFSGCTSLASVTIPDSVTSIGNFAFSNCTSLASVTIPNSVTSIGNSAFSGCTSLASVTIPDSVTSIGYSAFSNCTSLTSVIIPDSVTSIEHYAFENCTSLNITWYYNPALTAYTFREYLKTVIIPDSVTSIGYNAFSNCTSLTSVTIPNSVTSIGQSAFSGCTSLNITWYYNPALTAEGFMEYLKTVIIPDSVTSIGNWAFYGCTGLTSVTIPNSVTSIGNSAFDKCSSLTSVTIPNSVTSIGNSAFYRCTSLTSVTIPNSVTSIGNSAFSNCSSLTSVIIPDSVTSIGFTAFYRCTSLTSVTIPNSVTSIGVGAFVACTNLTSITIPNSVRFIPGMFVDNINNFSSDNHFDGDLRDKYLAANGGIGTYTTTAPVGNSSVWTKQ